MVTVIAIRDEMLDPLQLESFLAVARLGGFSAAGRRLGRQQSTVSQHVQKLEQEVGRRLFVRDTHAVTLTPDGEAMAGFAESILETNERAKQFFAGSQVRGRVRFGASEDFVVSSRLPELLRDFVRQHAEVDLELTVGLSANLYDQLDAGDLDLILCKRRAGDKRGMLLWLDQLVWIGAPSLRIDPSLPLPLILYSPPSLTRAVALSALEQGGRAWRIVCSSGSLSGLRAAALAGLGVTLHARGLIPEGLVELRGDTGLPDAGEVEFAVLSARQAARGSPAAALAEAILANGPGLRRQSR